MRLLRSVALVAAISPVGVGLGAQDRVLRITGHSPDSSGGHAHEITVRFDRPVTATLRDSAAAGRPLVIEPALAGRAEWRDPVTLRMVLDSSPAPGTRVRVTVDTTVRALDGARLAAPYRFEYRVPGPMLLARSFGRSSAAAPDTLPVDGALALLYSAPVDTALLRARTRIDLAPCRGTPARTVGVRVAAVQPRGDDAAGRPVWIGWGVNEGNSRRWQRIVQLRPVTPLPEGCAAVVVLATTPDDARHGVVESYPVQTAASFGLDRLACGGWNACPTDRITLAFTAPVRRRMLLRHVRFTDGARLVLADDREDSGDDHASRRWTLRRPLRPGTGYALRLDAALRDVHGRRLATPRTVRFVTGDVAHAFAVAGGVVDVALGGPRTVPVRHLNVRRLRVIRGTLPPARHAAAVASAAFATTEALLAQAAPLDTQEVVLDAPANVEATTRIPVHAAATIARPGLVLLRLEVVEPIARTPLPSPPLTSDASRRQPIDVITVPTAQHARPRTLAVQVTDLALHVRMGTEGGIALVTRADGRPAPGALVRWSDAQGRVVGAAYADADGVAALRRDVRPPGIADTVVRADEANGRLATIVDASLGDDRVAILADMRAIGWMSYRGLGVETIGGSPGWSRPASALLVTDRGIYRPGEWLHVKAIVRDGVLGAFRAAVGDTIRLRVERDEHDEGATLRDTTLVLGAFGTVADSVRVPPDARLGAYDIVLERRGTVLVREDVRVEEYRAPAFLLEATTTGAVPVAGDTARVRFAGRQLYGAPMARSPLVWRATVEELPSVAGIVPGTAGWLVGEHDWWSDTRLLASRVVEGRATLDDEGRAVVEVPVAGVRASRAARVAVEGAVTDIDRQSVGTEAIIDVRPSAMLLFARVRGRQWWWRSGAPAALELRAVHPDGRDSAGVAVTVTVERSSWSYDGTRWQRATRVVARATVRSTGDAGAPARWQFVPPSGGAYTVRLEAADGRGGTTQSAFSRYVIGGAGGDDARDSLRLRLVATGDTLAVGDSTSIAFVSPFDEAEALVTIERETIIERRRLVVGRGEHHVPLRITGAHVPNVFVTVMLVRRGAPATDVLPAAPGARFRVGIARLEVSTASKRLDVAVTPARREYLPGDTARVTVVLRDASGRPVRGEVAVWAVDEGVLALTRWTAPDPIARLYEARGMGLGVASSALSLLRAVPPALPAGFTGLLVRDVNRLSAVVVTGAQGGAPGAQHYLVARLDDAPLRTRFATTAFFVASAVTDADGRVSVPARLPDGLTTYRLVALAVDDGDRLGVGESSLLVTRPLVLRPTLPRFVRPADTLVTGAAVNVRDGGARTVRVRAEADGLALLEGDARTVTLAQGTGAEARFVFAVPTRDSLRDAGRDSVALRLRADDGRDADAVQRAIPVRPDARRRVHTRIGAVRGSGEVELPVPAGADLSRSSLLLHVGTTPVAPMLAAVEWLRAYPHDCTEQIASGGRALLAVWRTGRAIPHVPDPAGRVRALVAAIERRQRPDGAIAYWNDMAWSTPWLTTWAGHFLLDARDAGVAVDSMVLRRLAGWLRTQVRTTIDTVAMNRDDRAARRLAHGDQVAAVEYLRRAGAPHPEAEDALLAAAAALTWEDRLRLAELLAARPDRREAARGIADAAWRAARPAGNRVELPDTMHGARAFPSRVAPAARLLTATLALQPDHPLLAGLVTTVLTTGRAERAWAWSTQDYATVVLALARLERGRAAARTVRLAVDGRVLAVVREGAGDSVRVPLARVLAAGSVRDGALRLRLVADGGDAPVWYALTLDEVPSARPVNPEDAGIVVERWYERLDDGTPVTTLRAGELVRVRLRVHVPSDRLFVALEDPLPAGLEVVDPSLATTPSLALATTARDADADEDHPAWRTASSGGWSYGRWSGGGWSPWEHRAMHDDRVVHAARLLWAGTHTASYVARATTSGSFVRPQAAAEEMYNPAVQGRSDGGRFTVSGGAP